MTEKELTELSDQELLEKHKSAKSSPIFNAIFIGFMIGIIIYSFFNSTLGLVTLIPLFFIHKALKNSKKDEALEIELKSRKLI